MVTATAPGLQVGAVTSSVPVWNDCEKQTWLQVSRTNTDLSPWAHDSSYCLPATEGIAAAIHTIPAHGFFGPSKL